MFPRPAPSSVSSDTHPSTNSRFISLLIVLTLLLSLAAGCSLKAPAEKGSRADRFTITRESDLYSPEKVSATITDAQQVTQLLSPLENLTYRQQQNPYDTPDAAPFQDGGTLEHILFLSGAAVVEEYYIYGQFVSPTPAGPSSILTDSSQSQMQQYLDSLF